jgi:tetratricopeptide (TPR) repeat protein
MEAGRYTLVIITLLVCGLLLVSPAPSHEEVGETASTEELVEEVAVSGASTEEEVSEESVEETTVSEVSAEEEAAETVEEEATADAAEETAAETRESILSKEKALALARFIDKKARGLKAVLDKDMETAEEHFEEAGEIATENEDWENTLDAGYSLSAIGETESAKKLFDAAKSLTAKARDWRSMLAVGYAYATLPAEEDAADDAVEVMQSAEEAASEEENWRGLLEIGTGFREVKSADLAKAAYDKASHLLEQVRDSEGLKMLARGYEDLGEESRAREITALAEEAEKEEAAMGGGKKIRKRKERKEPPGDWSPTGKSLADSPKISDTSRKILAGKAEGKMREAHEKALMDAEAEREYTYEFRRYYFGPPGRFPYRRWDTGTDFDVNTWAAREFDRYVVKDGLYVLK